MKNFKFYFYDHKEIVGIILTILLFLNLLTGFAYAVSGCQGSYITYFLYVFISVLCLSLFVLLILFIVYCFSERPMYSDYESFGHFLHRTFS